jgi:predicted alpha/beta hydrolase
VALVAVTPFKLSAADGFELGATLFEPPSPPRRAVLVLPATGVPQEYYGKFSAFLAERGAAVLTFDYRGIGRSRPPSLRGMKARMRDWALLDATAAFSHLAKTFPSLLIVGHSFGGQALGLLPLPERIAGALVVGSQSGYWKNWPPLGRFWMWPAVHLALPAISHALGYFPSSRVGFGEDLPAGVAIEWASWCRNPRYLVGALQADAEYARFRGPLRAYSISDDSIAPPSAVEALLELYPAAKSEIIAVEPADAGAERIGHFGFFRERFRDTLWREAADWLEGIR